ncbi:MAG: hypothetical protein ACXV6M_13885, partial [Ilumatobacteraceae bacterium]
NNTDANEVDVDFYPVIRTSTGQLIAGQRRTATLTIDVKAAKGQSGGTRALKWIIGALLVALAALTVDWVAFLFGPNKDAKGGGLLIRRWPTRARRARSSKQPPDKGARDDPTTPDAAPSPPDNPTGR